MARIRTIKPDFMDSGSTRRLSRDARLFFLQLLTEADDEGRLKNSPKKLAGVMYPGDEDVEGADISRWIDECEAQDMVRRYSVAGEKYLVITNFLSHQKINRPTASKLPSPDYADDDGPSDLPFCNDREASRQPQDKLTEDAVSPPEKLHQEKEREVEKEREKEVEVEKEREKEVEVEVEREVSNSASLVPTNGFFQSDPKVIQNHSGFRSKAVTQILNNSPSQDGKELTPRERKQLHSQVDEWLSAGYEPDAISAAITASPFKTPNAVGGQLRKGAKADMPASWKGLGSMYEEALREESTP